MPVVSGPGAGGLRQRVWFERKQQLDPEGPGDGAGNFQGDWKPICSARPASLLPTRGGEQIIAGRLQGTAVFDLWVRFDAETAAVQPGDRAVDAENDKRQFAVRWAQDIDGRRRWILMQVELGVAT
jgi:hypothetical protein